MSELNQDLIKILECGGTFEFLVCVKEDFSGSFYGQPALIEKTLRIDKIMLNKDDIKDKDIQNQLHEYLKKNHVKEISLAGKVVWENAGKTLYIGKHIYTSY